MAIPHKPSQSTVLYTIYPPLPPLPPDAGNDLVTWYNSLTQWYDDLKRVLQNSQNPTP